VGPFLGRAGAGGGKRVSARICVGDWTEADLARAEAGAEPGVMAGAGALILIRAGEAALDSALDRRGWRLVDPVIAYAAPVAGLLADLPPLAAFPHWPPLAVARAIWEEGGIGPERLAVMERVAGEKTAVLARLGDRPAGVAFAACQGPEAMLHALEVRPALRRQGVGETLLRAVAVWAAGQGAERLSLVVTAQNAGARALYARLGMQVVGHYHYRMK
jgi:ribosomal protein S18 acetylase RimI-like enzyme